MDQIRNYVVIGLILFLMYHIPQPQVTYLVGALYIAGTILNKKSDAGHAAEKQLLKEQAENQKPQIEWHTTLGVNPNATLEECTKVRRLLTKIYHPDNGEVPNAETMRRINDAYDERQQIENGNNLVH